ncbi:MAG TPA: hypothetical protein VMH01_03005 [Puia sp.]|nr:hypothetical protein [Puia sp.]
MELNFLEIFMIELTEIFEVVKERFPSQSIRIDQLYKDDENFRSLCLDYFSSIRTLRNYKSSSEEIGHSITEYKNVIVELEKEFDSYFD